MIKFAPEWPGSGELYRVPESKCYLKNARFLHATIFDCTIVTRQLADRQRLFADSSKPHPKRQMVSKS
jgi:hypothetical protein